MRRDREDHEKRERLRDRQAAILGISRDELDRNLASVKRRDANGPAAFGAILDGTIFAGLGGILSTQGRVCARCGIESETVDGVERPVRLRLDPIKGGPPIGLGWVCTGRWGKNAQGMAVRVDCYDAMEMAEAQYHGERYREQRVERREENERAQQARKKGKRNHQQRLELVPPEEG